MPTATDLFEKARTHERLEILRAARERDMVPYFRAIDGQTGPVVSMEGVERLMLGSNNYLGLTGDPRVERAAREALESGAAVALEPMSATERKIVHLFLQTRGGVETASEGRDPERYVVVSPAR